MFRFFPKIISFRLRKSGLYLQLVFRKRLLRWRWRLRCLSARAGSRQPPTSRRKPDPRPGRTGRRIGKPVPELGEHLEWERNQLEPVKGSVEFLSCNKFLGLFYKKLLSNLHKNKVILSKISQTITWKYQNNTLCKPSYCFIVEW